MDDNVIPGLGLRYQFQRDFLGHAFQFDIGEPIVALLDDPGGDG